MVACQSGDMRRQHRGRARRNCAVIVAAVLLVASRFVNPSASIAAESGGPCRDLTVENKSYTVCSFDLKSTTLRLHWKSPGGEPYGNLGSLVAASSHAGQKLAFAMNAGMYHADGSPVGLYVEGGRQLVKPNTASGAGNFHMKPNGVFYFSADQAGVMETSKFLKARPPAEYATQSGPMLVIDGRLHPRFSASGPSLKVRNGVGVRDGIMVFFAISNEAVSFGDFARLFRDQLGCANALFLDGSISSLHAPSIGRSDAFWPVGPIVSARPRSR